MDKILFYKVKEPYGEFSNFSSFGFTDADGIYSPTSEHYFQAQKFASEELREKIRNYSSPVDATPYEALSKIYLNVKLIP